MNSLVNDTLDSQRKEMKLSESVVNGYHGGENRAKHNSRVRLFVLSCFDQKGGRSQAKSLSKYLADRLHSAGHQLLNDLAYTLGERRSYFGYKIAIAANSIPQLIERLDDETVQFMGSVGKKALAYVFTGQGAQWYAMGRELMRAYPVFYDSLVRASLWLNTLGAPWNLIGRAISSQKTSFTDSILQRSFPETLKTRKWGLCI